METRMYALNKSMSTVMLAAALASMSGSAVRAQCFLDIFGWGKSANNASPNPAAIPSYPYSASYPTMGAPYPLYGQTPIAAGGTQIQPYSVGYSGIPQSAISLASPTNYNTSYFAVPTTYYRPVTTTDPRTGQSVTTMMPCTSYQQQALRSPAWTFGQWVYGGSQVPMVPANALPVTPSSQGLMPQNSNSAVSSVNAADPRSVPSLPPINPSLPVYGTAVQSGFGNPSSYSNPAAGWGSNGTGVVSAYYPNGMGTTVGPTEASYSSTYGNPNIAGVTPTNSSLNATPGSIFPPGPAEQSQSTLGQSSHGAVGPGINPSTNSNSPPGVYPPSAMESQLQPSTMFRAEPSNPPLTPAADAAIDRPVLPPEGDTSRIDNSSRREPAAGENGIVQNIVRQPTREMREMSGKSIERIAQPSEPQKSFGPTKTGLESIQREESRQSPQAPALKPIPLPDSFDSDPQWNPSLLNSSDKTAAVLEKKSTPKVFTKQLAAEDVRYASHAEAQSTSKPLVESGRRTIQAPPANRIEKSRYDASGWQSAK
jgi:hypothetical protein